MKVRLAVGFCLLAVLGALLEAVPASGAPAGPDYTANRAIVGAKDKQKAKAEGAVRKHGGRVLSYNAAGNFMVVETPSDSKGWADKVKSEGPVRYAEPDYEVTADVLPSDPRWSELWGMTKIGMPSAWDIDTGSKSIVVGVIDTGVDYTHEDLAGQMWINTDEIANNGIDDDANGWVDDRYGADCANNDGNPMDDNNHGSHVAGTIGAAGNNAKGVVGVNWTTSIMALKFLGSGGSGSTSDAVECLYYAIQNGAHLTSNSWGGGGFSQTLFDAISAARNANQLFVAAAGNSAVNTDSSPHYPSSYNLPNIVSVAATTQTDSLASFSNYGVNSVDLAAPGVSILSTVRNNGYSSFNGTSMATPHVAGAAALLLSEYPSLRGSYVDLKAKILDNVDPVSALSGKVLTGGRLNVSKAIVPVDARPEVTSLSPSGPVSGVVTLRATVIDDVGVTRVEFFVGSTSYGVDSDGSDGWSSPLQWDTGATADGAHTLRAVAADTIGQTGERTSTAIVDNVDDPPAVSILSPAAGSAVSGGVTIIASASDDRGLAQVEFFVDGTSIGIDTSSSGGWTATWGAPSVDGPHVLTARATDSGLQMSSSAPVNVNVSNPPTSMHVHDLDGTSVRVGGSQWRATVTITVTNNKEALVPGATVGISWSTGGSGSCTTNSSGVCSVTSAKLRRSSVAQTTALVTNLSGASLAYNSDTNHNSDGDANATPSSITIARA